MYSYNKKILDKLVKFIIGRDGLGEKNKLASYVSEEFNLVKDRSVYSCDDFAIRFSKSESRRMSNTVLSLSNLQKYDQRPFLVCIVSKKRNFLLLANTTFLSKISHSSKELRINNIRGSFNGSDIMSEYNGLENQPDYFEQLYAFHSGFTFEDNLERLVESTNGITPRKRMFEVNDNNRKQIFDSIPRAQNFINSPYYNDLKEDLDNRVKEVQREIVIAAFIDNVNIRGRIIEYLITDNGSNLKQQILKALRDGIAIPEFKTDDKLGDYSKKYDGYLTETDIKTKVLFLDGNPKAYNIDKLLEFLSLSDSVYMIYLLGVDEKENIVARLCSSFDKRLISYTCIQDHWAGRASRGVTQFLGSGLKKIIDEENQTLIHETEASDFLKKLIDTTGK